MNGPDARRHAGDGDLVRLLDGELESRAEETLRHHVDGCEECARRLRRIEGQSDTFARLIDASAAMVPPAVPTTTPAPATPARAGEPRHGRGAGPAGRRFPWWRVAAAITLLLAAGLLAPPVRAWVTDQVDAVRTRLGGETAAPVQEAGATLLRLPAPDAELTVETARASAGAVLVVERVAASEAVLEVASPGATVVLIHGGFRLEDGAPGAEYRLGVPGTVERVTIRSLEGTSRTAVVPEAGVVRVPLGPQ